MHATPLAILFFCHFVLLQASCPFPITLVYGSCLCQGLSPFVTIDRETYSSLKNSLVNIFPPRCICNCSLSLSPTLFLVIPSPFLTFSFTLWPLLLLKGLNCLMKIHELVIFAHSGYLSTHSSTLKCTSKISAFLLAKMNKSIVWYDPLSFSHTHTHSL